MTDTAVTRLVLSLPEADLPPAGAPLRVLVVATHPTATSAGRGRRWQDHAGTCQRLRRALGAGAGLRLDKVPIRAWVAAACQQGIGFTDLVLRHVDRMASAQDAERHAAVERVLRLLRERRPTVVLFATAEAECWLSTEALRLGLAGRVATARAGTTVVVLADRDDGMARTIAQLRTALAADATATPLWLRLAPRPVAESS